MAAPQRCRLTLTTPPELVSGGVLLHDFLGLLERACDATDIACLLIALPETATDEAVTPIATPLIRMAQARDIAALVVGRAELAQRLGADGIHLDLRGKETDDALRIYRYARKIVGADAVIGTLCSPERHAAMEIAEADADYVGFDIAAPEAEDVIAWWGEVMTVPCVAFGSFDAVRAKALATARADFLAPESRLWSGVDPVGEITALGLAIHAG